MSSIEDQYKQALCDAANRNGITLQPSSISETFAIKNLARGTAIKCFRVDVAEAAVLPMIASLGTFRQSFHGVILPDTEQLVDVECVLSGPRMNNLPVDWSGVPTGTIG